MKKIKVAYYQSPAGELLLGSYDETICLCDWVANKRRGVIDRRICGDLNATYEEGSSIIIDEATRQLNEYFAGKRQNFSISVLSVGTQFQCGIWQELMKIPYGATVSYGEMARRIQNPKAIRAVASAIANNPISIFVPCHRVIGSDCKLTGYAGGLKAKQMLLDIERKGMSL